MPKRRYKLMTVNEVRYASLPGVTDFFFKGDHGAAIRRGGHSHERNFPPGTTVVCMYGSSNWVVAIARVDEISEDGRPLKYGPIVTNDVGDWKPPTETDVINDLR